MKTNVHKSLIKRRKRKTDWLDIVAIILYPLWKLWKGLEWLYNNLFFETHRTGDNGICGPGYHVFHETTFSWGKVAALIGLIILIIVLLK